MRVVVLLDGGQIQWLSAPLQIKSPIQVILEIPDDAIIEPIHREMISPSEKLLKILRERLRVELEPWKQTEEVAEFQHLTNTLFGEGYCYVPEKSDREILGEVLSEKYA
jgi:hypothetical protein